MYIYIYTRNDQCPLLSNYIPPRPRLLQWPQLIKFSKGLDRDRPHEMNCCARSFTRVVRLGSMIIYYYIDIVYELIASSVMLITVTITSKRIFVRPYSFNGPLECIRNDWYLIFQYRYRYRTFEQDFRRFHHNSTYILLYTYIVIHQLGTWYTPSHLL